VKYQEESQKLERDKAVWEHTATGAYDNVQAETASRVLCECEDSVELRPRCLGKHFLEPSDHDKIPLMQGTYCLS